MRTLFDLTVLAIVLVIAFLPIWAFIDVVRRPRAAFQRIHRRQGAWATVVLLLGFVGSVVYLVQVRPELRRWQTVPDGEPAG